MIAGQPQLPARTQHPAQLANGFRDDQAPLVVPGLRPWVGKEHEHPPQARGCEDREQSAGVLGKDLDAVDAVFGDRRQQRRDAVDVGLAADEADVRVVPGLRQEVFTGAEADLQPDVAGARRRARADRAGRPVPASGPPAGEEAPR